jgi:hypothetical protein
MMATEAGTRPAQQTQPQAHPVMDAAVWSDLTQARGTHFAL